MTTIAAVQTADDVEFSWDTQTTRGNESFTMVDEKVWCRNGIVFALAGNKRFCDLVYAMDVPDYDGSDPKRWIIRKLVPEIQKAVSESGMSEAIVDEIGAIAMGMVIVVDGTAFSMDPLLSPMQSTQGIYTLGSGGDYAMGALAAGLNVEDAVDIAISIDPSSGGKARYTTANLLIMDEVFDEEKSEPAGSDLNVYAGDFTAK